MRPTAIFPILALLLIPCAVPAQGTPAPTAPQAKPVPLFGGVEPLPGDLGRIQALILAGKWQEAKSLAGKGLWVLAELVDTNPAPAATVLALSALADAGLGNNGAAVCRWQVAQSYDPRLAKADLSAFGAPGRLLLQNPPPSTAPLEELPDFQKGSDTSKTGKADPRKPEIVWQPRPWYPRAAQKARAQGAVIVDAVIDKDGGITNARIRQHQPFGLDLSALDTVCGWRYKPATLDGQPIRTRFLLTIDFRVQDSTSPAPSR
jgi:TonB family protein